jgi:SAM-dependent methyltransferase
MEPTEDLRSFFDRAAPKWAVREFNQELMERLLDHVALKQGDRVLDLGGGTGHLLQALRRRVGASGVIAMMDLSPVMLRHATGPAAEATALRSCGAAEHLPLREDRWDAVIGMGLYPHLSNPGAALAEITRVLVPGGRVAFLHLIGRQRLNELHAGIGGAVEDHLLPAGDEVAAVLSRAGYVVNAVVDSADGYLIAGRCRGDRRVAGQEEKLERLGSECAKLDPAAERSLAGQGLAEDLEQRPEY